MHPHTSGSRSVSEAVVEAVAEAENRDPTELAPIHQAIDTDALDALFHVDAGDHPTDVEISFAYCGYDVSVASDDEIALVDRSN